MAFNDWLAKRINTIDYKIIATNLDIDEKYIEKLVSGTEKPNINLIIKIMYLFNLNEDEKIEYFSSIARTFNLSPKVIYQLIALHIAEKTQDEKLDEITVRRK